MIFRPIILGLVLLGGGSYVDPDVGPDSNTQDEPVVSRLVRWSVPEPMVGVVDDVNEQGVVIKLDGQDIPVSVPWFDVHQLEGASGFTEKYQQLARSTWRAHARLGRGDYPGAESIYAQLEEAYLWKVGKQSADVSVGLVRCRLDRQDRIHAVMPFLSMLMSVSNDDYFDEQEFAGFDSQYRVLIGLPPVFGEFEYARSVVLIPDLDSATQRHHVLAGYYALAVNTPIHRTSEAQVELDRLAVLMRGRDNRDAGLELIANMVIAQAHTRSDKRLAARLDLERRVRSNPDTWIELWARLAIGVSLLADDQVKSNERGAIELIHIVVRLDEINPPLALLASQVINEYFVRTQRMHWGNTLLLEAQNGGSND